LTNKGSDIKIILLDDSGSTPGYGDGLPENLSYQNIRITIMYRVIPGKAQDRLNGNNVLGALT
jgi:hypothetical protein